MFHYLYFGLLWRCSIGYVILLGLIYNCTRYGDVYIGGLGRLGVWEHVLREAFSALAFSDFMIWEGAAMVANGIDIVQCVEFSIVHSETCATVSR